MEKKIIRVNHDEMTNEYWRKLFLQMDHAELAQRFRLKSDARFLYVTFYCREYRIDKESGIIEDTEKPDRPITFDIRMSIFNLFHYAKKGAATCGRFVPFREVKGASPFAPAFQKSIAEGLAKPFNGKMEQLKNACIALKGEPISHGDVGYIIYAFDFMPVMLVFWDGDEEFEAQANLLFDADITNFIHEETVCCIAGNLMQRLKEIAEVHT